MHVKNLVKEKREEEAAEKHKHRMDARFLEDLSELAQSETIEPPEEVTQSAYIEMGDFAE